MFDDLFEDVASLGGAVFGGKIGSDLGKTIASDISDGNKTVTALGSIAGGLLGAYTGSEFIEGIFEDED
mgnify:FL=1